MKLTFLDFFAGVGGFRKGMEMAGHTCLGHCEIDKFANMSYKEIHQPKGSEWFGTDIRRTSADELPRADVWCFGFPCQDISVAGKQLGFKGQRSSLFFTVTRLIRDTKEEDRPQYLFIENVKNLLSVNGGCDFLKLLIELDEIGYDAEWQVLNSKNFGVPQNRERVFIIGHIRGRSGRKVFPIEGDSQEVGIKVIGTTKSKTAEGTNCRSWVHDINGIVGAISATEYKQPKQILIREATKKGYAIAEQGDSINLEQPNSKTRRGRVGKGIANTLTCSCNQGILDGYRIRKLTPLECWRLQGWSDEDFEKAAKVCSDSQLYKQAGNGVTVKVIYEIAKKLI